MANENKDFIKLDDIDVSILKIINGRCQNIL